MKVSIELEPTIPCEVKVSTFTGAASPGKTYGDLEVVEIPMLREGLFTSKPADEQPEDCIPKTPEGLPEFLISVPMEKGCPEGTVDMTWDDILSDATIDQGSTSSVVVKDGYPPFEWDVVSGAGFSLAHAVTNIRSNTLTAAADACGNAGVQVVDMCRVVVNGSVENTTPSELNWDYDASVETIAPGESNALIAVKDGTGPYSWSVSGTDIFLGAEETTGNQNVLNAGWSACGSAAISVSDSCGNSCTGYVRSTAGSWIKIEDVTDLQHACGDDFLSPGTGTSEGTFTETYGKYKVEEIVGLLNCASITAASCSASPTCCGDPYETYQTAASKQYHYPCICNINLYHYQNDWNTCCDLASSLWPCCRRNGGCGAGAGKLYSPYWSRMKYEWRC